ncbi:MAG: PQQ-dependent sugar dehydrogenase [Thermoleophilaceae bacterium]|nr:PQQ-dependent sugar dehydrogenase [Thermoleophilaceae bacterium]
MSVCRSMLAFGLVFATLAGCDSDEGDGTRAEPAGQPSDRRQSTTEDGSAAARGPVRLLRLGRFDAPTFLGAPRGDRRRFVVQRGGTIVVLHGGRQLDEPFLDVSTNVSTDGEGGLLSMAFAPDYQRSGRFYVYYTDREGYLQIDQFTRSDDPDRADPESRRSVIRVPHFRSNHKGGQLQFGPDGMLYAGFGDGGSGGDPDENAQNLGRILGKLIRIDPRPGGGYDVPASNPFVGRSGARGEIYAYGLRNPYRFSFDRSRGSLNIGDVGQDEVEEIDYVPGRSGGRQPRGGYNFGWDVFEGRDRYEPGSAPGDVPPVIAHRQSAGFCSIIGGYVIRDPSLRGTRYAGRYVYGDLCNPDLRLAVLKRPRASTRPSGLRVSNLVSFGEDGQGRVYAVSIDGPIYRIGRG